MSKLGEAGGLGVHLDRHGARFALSIDAMREASRACGSTGFLMWAHDVCGLYMEQSGNPELGGHRLDEHSARPNLRRHGALEPDEGPIRH